MASSTGSRRVLLTSAILVAVVAAAGAQRAARRATTVDAVGRYPGFYHEEPVALRGAVARSDAGLSLVSGANMLRLVGPQSAGEGLAEVHGIVYDIGRLNPDDPRLALLNLTPVLAQVYRERWPKRGEALVLRVTGSTPLANLPATPSIRDLALDPRRYDGQRVTLVGQFRGRNLYGELPNPPTGDPDGFVIRSSDGAVWVSGLQPQGKGFRLDGMYRDKGYTAQWVRVTGVMHHALGMPWMEGQQIERAEISSQAALDDIMAASTPAAPLAPVQVVFTSPIEGERDVPLDAAIRIQFSDDIDASSIDDHIQVTQVRQADGLGQAPRPVTVTLSYAATTQSLTIRSTTPFEPFSQITVRVRDGVRASNGALLGPFAVTFTTGNR